MTQPVNKHTPSTVATKNIDRIDNMVVAEVEKTLAELDVDIQEIDSYMSILRDRMIEATNEPSFPITLARFAEIRLASRKQKNESLKTLISYKSNEVDSRKRPGDVTSSIQDIMAGVGLGAAMASGNKLNISSPGTHIEIEDTSIPAEVIIEAGETSVAPILRKLL